MNFSTKHLYLLSLSYLWNRLSCSLGIDTQSAEVSKLWEIWSYRSRDSEGRGVIRRVQDVVPTCVLHPRIGTGVFLEFQRSGGLEVLNEIRVVGINLERK